MMMKNVSLKISRNRLVALGFSLILCFMGTINASATVYPSVGVDHISISGSRWIRPSTGPNTAAYLILTNTSGQSNKLIKVDCDDTTTVELHDNIMEDGVMKMRPVESIEIGKDPVELKPGGLHIMLMGLKDSFQGKKTVPLTLHFERAGSVVVDFPVKQPEKDKP